MYAQCCTASAAPTGSDELVRGGLWKCDAFRFIDSAFGLYVQFIALRCLHINLSLFGSFLSIKSIGDVCEVSVFLICIRGHSFFCQI